jgi:hypothetical protein
MYMSYILKPTTNRSDVSEPQDLEKVDGVPESPSQVHQLILGALSADPSWAMATMLTVSDTRYKWVLVSSPMSCVYIATNQIT